MSKKELSRLEVMQRLKAKRLKQREASQMLGISIRQVKRLYRNFLQGGAKSLVSQKRGKASNHRLSEEVVKQARDLIYECYRDFGPTLTHEKLVEKHKLQISDESVRKLMIAEGLWKPKRAKRVEVHQMRERRGCFGELVQIDGSDHAWFEGRGPRSTLLVYIDDATGQIMELWFVEHESFFGYAQATRHYLERYGRPVAFYSDKHGVFRVNQNQDLGTSAGITQFGRAMQELDIQILCANTPQAKGRVERANQTLQDRLVKDLRLAGISDIEAANAFLPRFIADYNAHFAVPAQNPTDAHRPVLHSQEELDLILCLHHTRTLSKNLSFQFKNREYQLTGQGHGYRLRGARITVCEAFDGTVTLLHQSQRPAYRVLREGEPPIPLDDEKSLHQTVDAAKVRQQATPTRKPAPDHPWRLAPIGKAAHSPPTTSR